jgi:hypothetical protein
LPDLKLGFFFKDKNKPAPTPTIKMPQLMPGIKTNQPKTQNKHAFQFKMQQLATQKPAIPCGTL